MWLRQAEKESSRKYKEIGVGKRRKVVRSSEKEEQEVERNSKKGEA